MNQVNIKNKSTVLNASDYFIITVRLSFTIKYRIYNSLDIIKNKYVLHSQNFN